MDFLGLRNLTVLEDASSLVRKRIPDFKIDDIPVASLVDYYSALESKKPGEEVTVVVRRNKKDVTLKIKLSESSQ